MFEEIMLNALTRLPSVSHGGITVKTPHLYYFDKSTNTQVQEDVSASLDLKSFLLSPAGSELSRSSAHAIGFGLGSWLRSFHAWISDGEQAELQAKIKSNDAMQLLKYNLNYVNLVKSIASFPDILEKSRDVFTKVSEHARMELLRDAKGDTNSLGIIHGDFWSGK